MSKDTGTSGISRELGFYPRAELLGDVAVHPVVLRPRLLGCIQVEAGRHAKIPRGAVAWNVEAARARVRSHEHEAELRRHALRAGLDHESLFRAGEPGQVIQHRHAARLRLLGHDHRKAHRGAGTGGIVLVKTDGTVETLVLTDDFESWFVGHYATLDRTRTGSGLIMDQTACRAPLERQP